MNKLLTTQQAAEKLGISDARIRQLILNGRLPAQKLGRDLFIEESDLRLVSERRPGRPRKVGTAKAKKAGKAGKGTK
jgi:excisionase family DNA binding protein